MLALLFQEHSPVDAQVVALGNGDTGPFGMRLKLPPMRMVSVAREELSCLALHWPSDKGWHSATQAMLCESIGFSLSMLLKPAATNCVVWL